jgi:hypothetical protein
MDFPVKLSMLANCNSLPVMRCIMNPHIQPLRTVCILLGLLCLSLAENAPAQRPQDNWYQDAVWVKTNAVADGGLVEPYGVAIGRDRRIYVGDQGSQRIQVYLPDGTFSFGITNGFGGGEAFGQPRGMICDRNGNLYVADYTNNCVFVFTADGTFVRKIGGVTGTGDGQLSGVIDVGVALDGQIYVLERGNSRVSVFDSGGVFLRKWGEPGVLDGQLDFPMSIAVAGDDWIYVCQRKAWGMNWQNPAGDSAATKAFDGNGRFRKKIIDIDRAVYCNPGEQWTYYAGASVRVDCGGGPWVLRSNFAGWDSGVWAADIAPPVMRFMTHEFETISDYVLSGPIPTWAQAPGGEYVFPCHAFGPDGTFVVCRRGARMLYVWRQALRELRPQNPNAIPMPAVWRTVQRPSSPLVDIDYEVTDADDATVQTGMLVFKNGMQSISNCIRGLTLVEGTATNLGPAIAANQLHRVTWNAGADWGVNLGDYRVAVLARDSRPGLLDIHYVNLPADRGLPALKISRSPLNTNDFMQVWWWLLATNDSGLNLSSNKIYGVSGAYTAKVLCDDGSTTADGRNYIFEKMQVREATPSEVDWARHGSTASTVNQWPSVRTVGGRPAALNEYGFDTGDWDTNTCRWVVPLH